MSAPCPNCQSTTFRKDPGIANAAGTAITWYKQGPWWSRLAGGILLGLIAALVIIQVWQFIIPTFPRQVNLLIILAFVGGAVLQWLNDMRKGAKAVKYTCQSCRLRWVVRANDPWPDLAAAQQQQQQLTLNRGRE